MSTTDTSKPGPNLPVAKTGARRKRFLAASVAALAVLAVAMGVSFLGNTGTTGVEVKAASSEFVFPVSGSGYSGASSVAEGTSTTLKEVVTELKNGSTSEAGKLPSWSPTVNTAGEVTRSGDLALVHTIGTKLIVNVYATNLADLQADYSSFALPIHVYEATCSKAAPCKVSAESKPNEWKEVSSLSKTYLTSTEGNLSFSLESEKYYDITIGTGGSFYTISTSLEAGLSPDFYFTAQAV